jgi:hypothetical protein
MCTIQCSAGPFEVTITCLQAGHRHLQCYSAVRFSTAVPLVVASTLHTPSGVNVITFQLANLPTDLQRRWCVPSQRSVKSDEPFGSRPVEQGMSKNEGLYCAIASTQDRSVAVERSQ